MDFEKKLLDALPKEERATARPIDIRCARPAPPPSVMPLPRAAAAARHACVQQWAGSRQVVFTAIPRLAREAADGNAARRAVQSFRRR